MAVMTLQQFREIVEPLMNQPFDGVYKMTPTEWDKFFTVERALERSLQNDPTIYGLGVATQKPEGQNFASDQGGIAYTVPYVQKVYGIMTYMTQELIEDGDHISFGRIFAEHMARAMLNAKEIQHANVLNFAINASYIGGDGKPLLATDHPLANGGTFSNRLGTPANISETSLEQLLVQARICPDERGLRGMMLNIKRLLVSPENEYNATRIVQSPLRSGTGNNDINATKYLGKIPEVMVISRLTNTTFYGLQTDVPRGFIHKVRRPVQRKMEGDFNTGNMRYKSDERYALNWQDPRVIFGNAS